MITPGVAAVAREHPLGVHEPRDDAERRRPRAAAAHRPPSGRTRSRPGTRSSRTARLDEQEPRRTRAAATPARRRPRRAIVASGDHERRPARVPCGAGPDGDGQERAADQHRHEQAPAGLEHDRPVGIPGDAEVDQPEAGEDEPGQGEERRDDADDEQTHRRRITAARRHGAAGSPVGVPGDALVGGATGSRLERRGGEQLGDAGRAAADVGASPGRCR